MSNIKHTTTMKHTMKCAVVLMFSMNVLESPAQFYTAEKVGPAADTLSISTDPYVRKVRLPTAFAFVSDRKVRKQNANFQGYTGEKGRNAA